MKGTTCGSVLPACSALAKRLASGIVVFAQMAFLFEEPVGAVQPEEYLSLPDGQVPVFYRENARARRYLLSVHRDGTVHVTIPRRGSRRQAKLFVQEKLRWVERQRRKIQAVGMMPQEWQIGTEIMICGVKHRISVCENGPPIVLQVGPVVFAVSRWQVNLRPLVEEHLHRLARQVLIPRTEELAGIHGLKVGRVMVRDQSTRWGSCSAKGTISLNWRLVQTPPEVADYIILHELMHLREMNHSRRFWFLVEQVCPGYREAEQWLKANAARLGM
ncbi:MAG: SprT family zinc-dependent metalloprotease [Candidatus Methylacidiphilales bacterium]